MIRLFIFIFILLSNVCFGQIENWAGKYEYSKDYGKNVAGDAMLVEEELIIQRNPKQDNSYQFIYEVSGYQTYYQIKGYALSKGNIVEFYFNNLAEGVYYEKEKIKKDQPFFILKYQQNKLLTKWIQPAAQKNFHPYFVKRR